MTKNIEDLEFFPLQEIDYKHWFKNIEPNGVTPTDKQRREMVSIIDERVEIHSEGLRLFYDDCLKSKGRDSEYYVVSHTISSSLLYIYQTISDCMVASKCYILADKDYDKRFSRGKLRVILNEGFKKLYGFSESNRDSTYWGQLSTIIHCFPSLEHHYNKISFLLEMQSKNSSWWKQERDAEVHLDPIKLYESRQEDISESQVMIDTIKLLDALGIAEQFLSNLHTSLTNWLNMQYRLHPEQFK